MKWFPLIIGGMLGTVLRFWLSGTLYKGFGLGLPVGTFAVNTLGCFLLGFFAIATEGNAGMSHYTKLLLTVGFCGAFTTFSTFILEISDLIRAGQSLKAFLYLLLSVVLGFFALRFGIWVGEWHYE